MNLKLASILSALMVSVSVSAQQSTTTSEQLRTLVTVSATTDANVYKVSAVVTDLLTEQVIHRPVLLVAPNRPASFRMGTQPGSILQLEVTVDADGLNASYRTEMIVDGLVVSGNSDRLRVQRGGA